MRVRTEEKRDTIVQAASEVFLELGFEGASMSQIAARVGGSKRTLYGYFGSKEDLFLAVMDSCKNGRDLMEGSREDFGERLAREIVYGDMTPCDADAGGARMRGLLILLRSVGSAKAMDVVQRTSNNRFFEPLTQWIGGEDAPVRARLAAGLIMGMAIGRELSDGYSNLDDVQKASLAKRMARALQGLIDG